MICYARTQIQSKGWPSPDRLRTHRVTFTLTPHPNEMLSKDSTLNQGGESQWGSRDGHSFPTFPYFNRSVHSIPSLSSLMMSPDTTSLPSHSTWSSFSYCPRQHGPLFTEITVSTLTASHRVLFSSLWPFKYQPLPAPPPSSLYTLSSTMHSQCFLPFHPLPLPLSCLTHILLRIGIVHTVLPPQDQQPNDILTLILLTTTNPHIICSAYSTLPHLTERRRYYSPDCVHTRNTSVTICFVARFTLLYWSPTQAHFLPTCSPPYLFSLQISLACLRSYHQTPQC